MRVIILAIAFLSVVLRLQAAPLGTILSDTFTRASPGTDWTNEGAVFTTIVNNQFYLTNTAANTWNAVTANTNIIFMSEQYVVECDITMTNAGFGVGIGVRDTSVGNQNWFMWLELHHSPSEIAIIQWINSGSLAVKATGSATLVQSVGDVMHLYFRRSNDVLICNATNTTAASSATASFQMNTASTPSTLLSQGPSFPALWQVSTQPSFVDNFQVSEPVSVPAELVVVGDSITSGLVASVFNNRWVSRLNHAVVIEAGPGRGIADATKCLGHIALLRPQRVLLMIGGNDSFDSGFTNNYNAFTLSLSNLGACVFHALPTPRTSGDKRVFKDWMVATYPSTHLDTWTNLVSGSFNLGAAYDSGDNTHPNDLGHGTAATNIFNPIIDNPNSARFRQTYHPYWTFF